MLLTKVEAKNFRNYETLSLSLSSPISLFLGDNGQGKTSILEAIYYGLRAKSFKPYIQHHFIKDQESHAFVRLNLKQEQGESVVEAQFIQNKEGLQKQIKYCGKKVGPSFLYKKIPVLVFTEEKMRAIRGGPEQRRNLIDDIIVSEGNKETVNRFKKILKEKNSLLRQHKKEEISYNDMKNTLEALNENFLNISVQITQLRLEVLKNLFKSLEDIFSHFFTGGHTPTKLNFSYLISEQKCEGDERQIHSQLSKSLSSKTDLEIQLGTSLSGPQKHEIKFMFNDKDSRFYCSQGQQRIYMLSILGSQIKKMSKGLFFLDDVLMELDDSVEEKFLRFLEKIEAQSLITNCKKNSLKLKNMSSFLVKNATIKPYD